MNPVLVAHLYLAIAIIAEVSATLALKAAEGFTRPVPSILAVGGYAIAFFCLSMTLRALSMGIVYAIWSGIGIVLIALAGWAFYRQSLDMPALIGMSLILAGVLVINLFSKSVAA